MPITGLSSANCAEFCMNSGDARFVSSLDIEPVEWMSLPEKGRHERCSVMREIK